jgi:hypothetical protein
MNYKSEALKTDAQGFLSQTHGPLWSNRGRDVAEVGRRPS